MLTPDTAHGTNPAELLGLRAICGHGSLAPDGRVDLDDLRKKVDADTAALMITNPNTAGLFDPQITKSPKSSTPGALIYLDGANMNAILGIARPGDFGVDVMHYNTHKTFTPPTAAAALAPARWASAKAWRNSSRARKSSAATMEPTGGQRQAHVPSAASVPSTARPASSVRAYAYIRALGPKGLVK